MVFEVARSYSAFCSLEVPVVLVSRSSETVHWSAHSSCASTERKVLRAQVKPNFLQVQLRHPPGGGDAGLRGGGARRRSAGGREHGGGSPLGRGSEREPIGQPRLLPIMRFPPIPPVRFPKSRSHCAAQMWRSLCQSLEDRVGIGISRVGKTRTKEVKEHLTYTCF